MSLLAYVRERKFKKALQLLSSNDAAAVAEAQARRPPSDSDSSSFFLPRASGTCSSVSPVAGALAHGW